MGIKDKSILNDLKFMASRQSYEEAEIILLGAPMDFSCSFRPGARFGPQKIREVSYGLEEYSVYQNKNLCDSLFFDCGDLELIYGDVQKSHDLIRMAASEILLDGKTPIFVGGEHSISLPVIQSVRKKYGEDLVVIHMDAHADLRDDYMGLSQSHASVIRRIVGSIKGKNIFQLGIRSGTQEEFIFAKNNTNLFKFNVYDPLKSIVEEIKDRPVYVTLDIDVVDPAFANGTGTPEPCGLSSNELLDSIQLLKDVNLCGFDIVEVSPVYDNSDRTALLAAKVLREVLILLQQK